MGSLVQAQEGEQQKKACLKQAFFFSRLPLSPPLILNLIIVLAAAYKAVCMKLLNDDYEKVNRGQLIRPDFAAGLWL